MRFTLANARHNLSKRRVSALDFVDILKNQKLVGLAKQVQERAADLYRNSRAITVILARLVGYAAASLRRMRSLP